jgi:hypothetical protein
MKAAEETLKHTEQRTFTENNLSDDFFTRNQRTEEEILASTRTSSSPKPEFRNLSFTKTASFKQTIAYSKKK